MTWLLTWLLYEYLVINYWFIIKNVSYVLILVWNIIRHAVMLKRSKLSKVSDHPIDPLSRRLILISRLFRNPLLFRVAIGDCTAIFVFKFEL